MILHPREKEVRQAEREMMHLHFSWLDRGLTRGETIRILSDLLMSVAKHMIREERHPNDPSKPGGLK